MSGVSAGLNASGQSAATSPAAPSPDRRVVSVAAGSPAASPTSSPLSSRDTHQISVRATLDRENITLLDASGVREHLRAIDNFRSRIVSSDEKHEALASSERARAVLADDLNEAKAEHVAVKAMLSQKLDAMTAQVRAATESRDAARITIAKLRAQIAGMTKRYSGMEAEHKAWAQQRENHAERVQASERRSQIERARLSEEILSLRAKVSQHLSAKAVATTELEALAFD